MVLKSLKNSKPPLRTALIGPGVHAGRDILPALRLNHDVELVIVASRDLQHAQKAALEHGASAYTDHWPDVLDPGLVDIVVATASASIHAEILSACLVADIPVFVDKPPAADLATVRKVAELERTTGGLAFIGYNFAFCAPYCQFMEKVTAHDRVACLKIRFVSSQPRTTLGKYGSVVEAILLEGGTHAVDLAVRRLGMAVSVSACSLALLQGRHSVHIVLQHHGGAQSIIELGSYSQRFEITIEAIGWNGTRGILDQLSMQRIWASPSPGNESPVYAGEEWPPRRGGFERSGYSLEIAAFIASVRAQSKSASSVADAVPVYDILEAALQQIEHRSLSEHLTSPVEAAPF